MGHASSVDAVDVETQLLDVADASLQKLTSLRKTAADSALERVLAMLLAGDEGDAVSPFTSYLP
ncbi:hypothetical protein GCM10020358_52920 [Amorphoplanes nipponensis]|uniref:Uncharacterized protein n=1 Tax=Actinoplanes nipponensis TaxID=135950 RepID=A0A919JH68_9ACTN|nr:hypothetical protein [Actinoplanes nipponensis]GIE49568.1 hypothetical protein Ani05nite_31020 [Actinoplanes nipponensis]